MDPARLKRPAIATLALTTLLACGNAMNPGDAATDATTSGDASVPADSTTADTAPSDARTDPDAFMPGFDAGPVCSMVAQMGATVTPACLTTMAPVATGGAIQPGTYVLTSVNIYGADTPCAGYADVGNPFTAVFDATTAQIITTDTAVTSDASVTPTTSASTFTYTASGAMLSFIETCPGTDAPRLGTYTATSTTLHLFYVTDSITTESVLTLR